MSLQNNVLGVDALCDLVIIGSGAGGLSTAITATKRGLNVIVVEKEAVYGGTTAFSGGVLWVPNNPHAQKQGINDSREAAVKYLQNEAGEYFDAEAAAIFFENGPKMVEFFERETSVKFVPTLYPDYHPTVEGGVDIGRSILAAPFDIRELGDEMSRLRPPLKTITFMGMMFNSSNADLKHFFNVTKSPVSFVYVAKRLGIHTKELALYKRGTNVTSGNALAARLAKSAFDLNIPIFTNTAAKELIIEQGKVVGLEVKSNGQNRKIFAKHGVVIASGGFSHDKERLKKMYPHVASGGEHFSPVPTGNTGDGLRLAESAGGRVSTEYADNSAWMPVSRVPMKNGGFGVFPHLLDRYKPGIIGVLKNGQRFCNESESYHDVGAALMRACAGEKETAMWLVCDAKALAKYGLGYVKPAPLPHGKFIKQGYLFKGATLEALAQTIGMDAQGLRQTVENYNLHAVHGEDPQFNRGTTSFNRYLADPENQPNPCVAPISQGPFYAVKVYMGDLGTFNGIETTAVGEVMDADNQVIEGLYAVGNDRKSVMGGNYPGAGITLGPIMTYGYVTGNVIADKAQIQHLQDASVEA
ncbi:FAD-dependent oxidoreductase [Vitreoscilla stercoraria]|uniref:FAD-dependent oxidoreductase n=1 Tax=Vitreoscilla stercoraria TaxID=61 RepID=A0ABY4EEC8_VITST|nr:FAD-dependent oxidoreductase [Vitreoscilla stercoraria]UOO93621.1 FAD-dependent oxidoreductase [Vitreoscilla stercoraria]